MGNATWVCFDCREAVRRNTQYRETVPCPKCTASMRYLGYKIPVPRKRDASSWDALREQLNLEQSTRQHENTVKLVRRRHDAERELQRLEAKPSNPGRKKAILRLKKELDCS